MISKKFLTSSIIYTLSSALSTVASFLLLPFYTNTGLLNIGDYGALSLYIGFSLLVQVFTNLCIDSYANVAYHEFKDEPEKLKAKIASLNGYMIFAGLVIVLLFYFAGNFFIKYYIESPNPSSFRYLMMSVLTGVFNAHFKFYNVLLVNREKPGRYFWSNILNFVTTVAFSILILKMFPLTLEGPLWGRLLSCLSIFIWSFTEVTYTFGIAFSKEFIKPTFKFCFPLLVTTFFQWILSYSDRYIIKPLLFNKEVAIFDLAVRFSLLVNFLADGLNSAMNPKVFSLMREKSSPENLREINKYFSGFNLVMLLMIPCTVLVIPVFLPVFISDGKYLEAFLYFGIISSGLLTRGMINLFLFPIYFYRKTSRLVAVNGIAAALQIGLAYIMVRYFKLYGAAITLNVVKIVLVGLYFYYCRDLLNEKINVKKLIWLPLAAMLIMSIPEFLVSKYGIKMHLVHLAEFLGVISITFLIYQSEISDLMKWGLKLTKRRQNIS